ncbi:MAG: glycosyltransferase [Candidatus Kapabacteria bacterium]|nr:glycosyltransferase [Candidatus Kapabacteria bacterium]
MKIVYDVCLISFSDISCDARSLNIIRTLENAGKSVAIISFGNKVNLSENAFDKNNFYVIPFFNMPRNYQNWLAFNKYIKNHYPFIEAKTYWAADLYSLAPAVNFKKTYGGHIVYDSREIFSALGPLSGKPLKQAAVTYIEKRLVAYVDSFVTSGKDDSDFLKEHFKTNKIFTEIYNFPPYQEFNKTNILRKKFNIDEEKKILIYQGKILRGRGLVPALNALEFAEDFVLCVIGDGEYEEKFREIVKNNANSSRVFFYGVTQYQNLHSITCSADCGLAFIEPITFSYSLALPNKLFEYCMARIPSIVSDLPAMRPYIEKYGIGEILSPIASAEEFAKALNKICNVENKEEFINKCDSAARVLNYDTQSMKILVDVIN